MTEQLAVRNIFINVPLGNEEKLSTEEIAQYFYALNSELKQLLTKYQFPYPIETVYFASEIADDKHLDKIADLLKHMRDVFTFSPNSEISLELHPADYSQENLNHLARLGLNRVVLKQYSFVDKFVDMLFIKTDEADYRELLSKLRTADINNISTDLVYNFPGQTQAQLEQDLKILSENNIDHIYISDFNTYNYHSVYPNPDLDREREFYWFIVNYLKEQGYSHDELFALAKASRHSKHNHAYWNSREYLGLGAQAAGYINAERYRNPDDLSDYVIRVKEQRPYEIDESLSMSDKKQEFFILSLNKLSGFSAGEYRDIFAESWPVEIDEILLKLMRENYMLLTKGRYSLSSKGIDYLDTVLLEFFVDNLFI